MVIVLARWCYSAISEVFNQSYYTLQFHNSALAQNKKVQKGDEFMPVFVQ